MGSAVTAAVAAETAVSWPSSLRTVSNTRSRLPRSAATTVYEVVVAPPIGSQLSSAPLSQRSQCQEAVVPLPPFHVALTAVSVSPTSAVPEISGACMISGAAASAAAGESAASVSASKVPSATPRPRRPGFECIRFSKIVSRSR